MQPIFEGIRHISWGTGFASLSAPLFARIQVNRYSSIPPRLIDLLRVLCIPGVGTHYSPPSNARFRTDRIKLMISSVHTATRRERDWFILNSQGT
jgi:hypothetical protein